MVFPCFCCIKVTLPQVMCWQCGMAAGKFFRDGDQIVASNAGFLWGQDSTSPQSLSRSELAYPRSFIKPLPIEDVNGVI